MIGIGSTATAITSIVNGGVRYVTVTNRGRGYTSTPEVIFGTSPTGETATGIATMIGGITDLCEPDDSLLRVQGVQLTNPGYGYTIAPTVSFYGGGGTGAEATSVIGDGIVGIVTLTSGGSGYAITPNITFVGIASTSAQAIAIMNNGSISEIRMINSGLGYTEPPTIIIDSPYSSGFGTYRYNEEVVGSASSMTARVRSWDATTLLLQLSNASGSFTPGELIVGQESGASYQIRQTNQILTTEQKEERNIKFDYFAQNDDVQIAANDIIDFSEINPFGTP